MARSAGARSALMRALREWCRSCWALLVVVWLGTSFQGRVLQQGPTSRTSCPPACPYPRTRRSRIRSNGQTGDWLSRLEQCPDPHANTDRFQRWSRSGRASRMDLDTRGRVTRVSERSIRERPFRPSFGADRVLEMTGLQRRRGRDRGTGRVPPRHPAPHFICAVLIFAEGSSQRRGGGATDRACTSSPTLVRSVNTGASSHLSERPNTRTRSVTHD